MFPYAALMDSGWRNILRHVPGGAVLYYPALPEGFEQGIIKDFSGQGNNGAITGATWARLPSGLSSLTFPTGGGMITVADAPSLNFAANASFTLKAWVRTISTANYQQVFSKSDTVTGNLFWILRIEQTSGQVLFRIADGTATPFKQGAVVVTDGKWHQIIGRRNVVADDLRIFIDSVQDGAAATDTTTATLVNKREDLIFKYQSVPLLVFDRNLASTLEDFTFHIRARGKWFRKFCSEKSKP